MLAIIGGTGLTEMDSFELEVREKLLTPYADEPVEVEIFSLDGKSLAFLSRHGKTHAVPPHKVNYRANIAALKELGVDGIVAINAVGGIHEQLAPGSFIVPDQLIDYTHSRAVSFFEDELEQVVHIDFSQPFDSRLRQRLLDSARRIDAAAGGQRLQMSSGVYGCTQGPRLETAAEIRRLKQDGCDIVGMTAMPEAALAREKSLAYAMLAQSVNWAAGMTAEQISMDEIRTIVGEGREFIIGLIRELLRSD
jgi:5'-methylthioinosine phosphorylase